LFEERLGTLLTRSRELGLGLDKHVEARRILLTQVDPAELAPDQFTGLVRDAVERQGARLVVIDSINGYFNAMPEGRFLTLQIHELLGYLGEHNVASIMTMAQTGMLGAMSSPVDVSYLSDTVIMLRYFEAVGRIRKALSVVKKRTGRHEDTIRELTMDTNGLHLTEPLTDFRGILSGIPHLESGKRENR
jgi:circadian clock protein KaiC